MARTMAPNSAGSQFFIMVEDAPHLDDDYASFGKVIEGMEVADAIVNTKRDWNDRPREVQRMKKVTVDGNYAASNIAYMMNEVAMIYPITPSSPMAENCDQFVFENKKNM